MNYLFNVKFKVYKKLKNDYIKSKLLYWLIYTISY
jgi:hypothetical protein